MLEVEPVRSGKILNIFKIIFFKKRHFWFVEKERPQFWPEHRGIIFFISGNGKDYVWTNFYRN